VELKLLSAPVVPAFVPLLPVRLKLTGAGGLPGSADIQVGSLPNLPVAQGS
jgi:hypothetical protein